MIFAIRAFLSLVTLLVLVESLAVDVTLYLVSLLLHCSTHPGLFLLVNEYVLIGPFLFMDLFYVITNIPFPVIAVATFDTPIRLWPWIEMKYQVLDQLHPSVEHFIALIAFEGLFSVQGQVKIVFVAFHEGLPTHWTAYWFDLEVNCGIRYLFNIVLILPFSIDSLIMEHLPDV